MAEHPSATRLYIVDDTYGISKAAAITVIQRMTVNECHNDKTSVLSVMTINGVERPVLYKPSKRIPPNRSFVNTALYFCFYQSHTENMEQTPELGLLQ